jgi:putative molybdopterin biosynthesis protein
MRQRDYFMKGPQALFDFMRQTSFAIVRNELGGYDVSDTGAVRLVN